MPSQGKSQFLRMAQCVSEIAGQFVDALVDLRIRVLHRAWLDLFEWSTGFEIDDSRVRNHLRMNVPVGRDRFADHFSNCRLADGETTRYLPIQPTDTSRVGNHRELAANTALVAPVGKASEKIVRYLGWPAFARGAIVIPCDRAQAVANWGMQKAAQCSPGWSNHR